MPPENPTPMFASPSPFSAQDPGVVPPRIRLTIQGGQHFPGGLAEWMTDLIVQGGTPARALMLLNRHNGDLIGRPIGLFSMVLPSGRLERLVDQLSAVEPNKLPKGMSGDVAASILRLSFKDVSHDLNCVWNAADGRYRGAIGPAMDDLTALLLELLTKPEGAMTVTVERTEEGGAGPRLRIRLTNGGTSELVVGDPRLASPLSPEPRAYVRVAPLPAEVPGQMELPPEWRRVSLEGAPLGTSDEGVHLPPRGSLTYLTLPWTAPASGGYVAQAIWQDYYGPVKLDPTKVQGPVPADANPGDKPFVLRGAAFSSYLRFDASKR